MQLLRLVHDADPGVCPDRSLTGPLIDDLTGAYIRDPGMALLHLEVLRAKRTLQPLTLAFVEVDDLSALVARDGCAAGDQLLVDVVVALRSHLRAYDVVARHGGGELVCFMPGMMLFEAAARLAVVKSSLEGLGWFTAGLAELRLEDTSETLLARALADLRVAPPQLH